ncbi:4-hydroxybenzoyl-CoA reductase subunit alpha [Symmachiella dynata]|uniref:xanthine dehydrogenase family protein molybdopterin-binding subunit n=1 Tax=Symmachiella dynata TaxID=2527995 RepID=UPI00118BAA5F|nr:xanthine dehydrogenase family protein molybdopterin-binding subunit [Symmachiella dynata]QDT50988.1 4-hydroxybenzoyl-CoA reductase subunit alpha [Symmachiella dynata]
MATVEKTQDQESSTNGQYKVIGTRPIRHDGVDKVTGRARYGGDTRLTGMLPAAMLRSPHAHAKIISLDTSKAEALPGVRAVATSADLPDATDKIADLGEGSVNLKHLSDNVLAHDRVLYRGHAIAAVAADDIHIAQEAVGLIEVKYELLPPVMNVLDAMKADAPLLHDDIKTNDLGETADQLSNIATHICFEKGDLEAGFAAADVIVEREFHTATVHQGYIEPHNATALWNADGHITIWMSTQGTFTARQQTAELLDVPVSRVKVVPMEIGGGFGGKISVYLPPVAAILSKKTGRPVQMLMSRTDVFEATGPTSGSTIRVKMGADSNGRITAAEAWLAYEAGAYPGSPVGAGAMCVFACYDVPNGKVDGFDVVVNKPRTNAYRAPGATNAAFATETVIDELCEKLKLDPVEFRINNAAKEGVRRVDGPVFPRVGMIETVEAIRDSEHYQTPLEGKYRGRGMASGFWFNVGLKSTAQATVNADGTVALIEGSTDIGGSRAGIAMQLAETLGIAAEDVVPTVVDTDSIGYTDVTGGSRVTFATGWAAYLAAKDIQGQLIERAAKIWDCDVAKIDYKDGAVVGPDGKRFTFKEIAAEAQTVGEPVIGRGSADPQEPGGAFGTHLVDVEVDIDTGKVTILRYTAAQDAGTAIHPAYVEGQIQGGVVQGIGWGLNEEYYYDDKGTMRNSTYLDYRMPTSYDLPMIDTIIVEVPNPGHPYGVRGVGEVPIVPPPAALANAIYDAIGIRMHELPMSPPKVLHEILKQQ